MELSGCGQMTTSGIGSGTLCQTLMAGKPLK
jgi:hypothetical protein